LNGKKPALEAWKLVTKPKMKGGLGVIRLRLQNEALLLKNLHKFFTKANIPWVKLLLTKYYSNGKVPGHVMKGSFKGIAQAQVGSSDSILFWKDMWNGRVLYNFLSYFHLLESTMPQSDRF
jgi:hypothetical protein